MKVTLQHCDNKPQEIEIKDGDKVGFVCENCQRLFEADSKGKITKSPLNQVKIVDVIQRLGGNCCTGFGGRLGSCMLKVGDK